MWEWLNSTCPINFKIGMAYFGGTWLELFEFTGIVLFCLIASLIVTNLILGDWKLVRK